jgi:hypothetical protein
MVRIPERPYAHLASGKAQAPRSSASELVRSLGGFAETAFSTAMTLLGKQDHDALVRAQNAYADNMDKGKAADEAARMGGRALAGFGERHGQALEAGLARLEGDDLSGEAERAFRVWAEQRHAEGFRQAARDAHGVLRRQGQEAHEQRLQGIFAAVERSPQDYDDGLRQLEESFTLAVGQGLYGPGEAAERLERSGGHLRERAFNSLYDNDPAEAMRRLEGMGFDEEQKNVAALRFAADQAGEAARAGADRELRLRCLALQGEEAEQEAARSGDVGGLRGLADAYAALGEEDKAEEAGRLAYSYMEHAPAIRESAAMPLPRLEAVIRELEAAGPEGGKGEELRLRSGVYEDRLRRLLADPAGAVAADVERALGGVGEGEGGEGETALSPALMADMRLAAQEYSGLPRHRRRVLSNAEAARFWEAWRVGGPEERRDICRSLAAYGEYAGMAAGELGLSRLEGLLLTQATRDPRAEAALAAVLAADAAREAALPAPAGVEKDAGRGSLFSAPFTYDMHHKGENQ